jgi:hypothetical protein
MMETETGTMSRTATPSSPSREVALAKRRLLELGGDQPGPSRRSGLGDLVARHPLEVSAAAAILGAILMRSRTARTILKTVAARAAGGMAKRLLGHLI